jgi:cytochrome c-type biogenesis protein CcsB
MKQFWKSLFSSQFAMPLLGFFIITIGAATFIEEAYDTATAQLLIYNAVWFEVLMFLLVILYIIMMFRKNLLHREKIPQLIFHFSFVILFIGGGITRYFGYEGNMHIVENEAVSRLYTAEPYLQIRANNGTIDYSSDAPLYFSQIERNDFQLEFPINDTETLEIKYENYIFEAKDSFALNGTEEEKIDYQSRNPDRDGPDALMVTLTYKGKTHKAILFYDDTKYIQKFKPYNFDGLVLEMTYGPKPIALPFALQLEKFTLTKYPGTNIPSASESRVVLIDDRYNLKKEHVIAKNKVLDYDGYRFFQTSYDDDEKGTILTVNYDYYGTRITYFGYILMILGALLILISKKSHFSQLDTQIKQVRAKRKTLLMTFLLIAGMHSIGFSQNTFQNPITDEHAERFGHLLVQTYDGRFSSVHSLAKDVIHKITGEDHFNFEGKGKMDTMEIFLDILVNPHYWKNQHLIVTREQALRDLIGVNQKHISFSQFTNADGGYRLDELSIKAFQKKAADQTSLEREIIKVTERVTLLSMLLNGTFLKIFPLQDSENNEWISWNVSQAMNPLYGDILMLNEDLKLKDFNYNNIMRTYLISTIYARESNDYSKPDKLIALINSIQRQLTPDELMPSKRKVELEVLYNKSNIFDFLKYVYAFLGIGLLVMAFIQNFRSKPVKKIQLTIKILIALIIAAFTYQTFGMGLRWYLGGHAPWSNGYEVLLLVAWGSILAGFSVIKYSKITLAATALLAFLILMTAGHSYYDPQLTNLNPVLKSYWLIIHVAIITIGYGFLALSFLLGLINIAIHLFKTKKKAVISTLVIEELTYINEKLLTIGMFLTAIGTFIGCIWANESWGTYWSWNAKQTWSLIIVLVYGVVLHFKYIPKMKSFLAFNIGAVISFGSVLMTFVGVNYYFTKGLHSYASDDPPIFPVWAWIAVIVLLTLIVSAVIKENYWKKEVRA